MGPVISIIHPTARIPDGWKAAWRSWTERCSDPGRIEYILSVDAEDVVKLGGIQDYGGHPNLQPRVVVNYKRKCSVDAANAAAAQAKGKIFMFAQDDFFPPDHWDDLILEAIGDRLDSDFVLHCSTGAVRDDGLIYALNMSAARYQRLGYMFYPGYISVYSDDDLTKHAYHDGVVIQARGIMFQHNHPYLGGGDADEVYQWQNKPEAYAIGAEILKIRVATGFCQRLAATPVI